MNKSLFFAILLSPAIASAVSFGPSCGGSCTTNSDCNNQPCACDSCGCTYDPFNNATGGSCCCFQRLSDEQKKKLRVLKPDEMIKDGKVTKIK